MTGIFIAVGLFVVVGGVLLVVGLSRKQPATIEDRLAEFGTLEQPVSLEELELSLPFAERIALPLLRGLAQFAMRFTPAQTMETTQHKLDLAGNPYGWGPTEFLGIRFLGMLLLGGLGITMFFMAPDLPLSRRIMIAAGALGFGFILPTVWLNGKISTRQKEVLKSLPDALDLLTICVEAGLGFDSAMGKVSSKWDNELCRAFMRVLQEINLGKLRREALRDMADRMDVRDVSTFAAAIIQADQLGVSIARVLRIQSEQMRMRRRQRAEELARSAGIKMIPVIVFLIFPAIFVILMGPAAIKMITMDNPLFGGGGGLP